jgi:signal transduction histidine kinase
MALPSTQPPGDASAGQPTDTLRGVLDTIPAGVFVSEAVRDESGVITDFWIVEANPMALQTVGLTREAVVGHLTSVCFPKGYENGAFARYRDVVETQQVFRYDIERQDNDEIIWIDTRLAPHGPNRVITSLIDVTPLRVATRQQQQQAELLASITRETLTAILVHEAIRDAAGQITDYRITFANPKAAEWMHFSVAELLTKTLSEVYPGVMQSYFAEQYQQVIETAQPTRFEQRVGDQWFDFSVAKLGDGFVASAVNTTQSHHQRQQLETLNHELTRSNENLQQFAYVASHDLQEPLRKIQAFSDLLHQQFSGQLSPDAQDIVHRMQNAAQRASTLIRDLLTYSRVSTERQALKRLSLATLLTDVLEDLDFALREVGGQVQLGQLPTLPGDQIQLRQLFHNLLSNAIKFRQPNQPPVICLKAESIRADALPTGRVVAGKLLSQLFWRITVQDNGIGFDAQHNERIFQLFQRLHGKNRYAGTGIGLAIARRVAENHGGFIIAESTPGAGAIFSVYLPG